jgi:hypothetical protein
MELSRDVKTIWNSETTDNVQRKQLLRALIRNISLIRTGYIVKASIKWHNDATTKHNVDLKINQLRSRTDPSVIARISELALTHLDQEIADVVNSEGLTSRQGKPFTRSRVNEIRFEYNITGYRGFKRQADQRKDGIYSPREAAKLLLVHRGTVIKWAKLGLLDATQNGEKGYWRINLTPERIDEITTSMRQRRMGSQLTEETKAIAA